jgi:AraC-like DNA-binding protein
MLIFELQHVQEDKNASVKLLKVTSPLTPQALGQAVNAISEIEDSSLAVAPIGAGGGRLAPWQEQTAKDLLRENIATGVALQRLADACELSVRHFSRAFRQSTGTTPHAWLVACRIEKAKVRLNGTQDSLRLIAKECGFSDQSHFTRVFLRAVGSTPAAWRRGHRN